MRLTGLAGSGIVTATGKEKIMYSEPLAILKCAQRRRKARRNERIKSVLRGVTITALTVCIVATLAPVFVDFILTQAEKESAWRADRLCRIYSVCDAKAGP